MPSFRKMASFLNKVMAENSIYYSGDYYHIYNRAVGNDLLFYNSENYHYFLRKSGSYLNDCFEFLCYCLLPNHFHFLVRAKQNDNHNLQLRRLFISYAMAINKVKKRKGSLFIKPYLSNPIKGNMLKTTKI